MSRIGFAVGYDARLTIRDFAEAMRLADARGFEMGFFSETFALMRDGVTAMAAFALATRQMRLGFTQIVRLRSPVVMAQTAATLDELSGSRLVLCPGAATDNHAGRYGFEPHDPVEGMREWVSVIRRVLAGESVTYDGRLLRVRDAQLGWTPVRPRIPLWFAATSTTGLRLAGRLGDGVLLNTVSSPEYSANAVAIVKKAVEEAGRDWSAFEVAQIINTSVEGDHDAAVDAVRWEVAYKFLPMKFKTQSAPRRRVGDPYYDPNDLPRLDTAFREGGKAALERALSPRTVENLTASGTPSEVLDRVERYRAAGVRLPILRPAAHHQIPRVLDLAGPG
ncbi:MAG: LLM class flavin-dependent oxidoreductase [Armatimonadetes bacterium]|nr:LLM class flavin-dependent oxidoreductase [Armatimonadota bacterium]